MLRSFLIGVFFAIPYYLYSVKTDGLTTKKRGWLIFRDNVGVLFAQDSLPYLVNSDIFFDKVIYTKGVDVTYYDSIYSFEKDAKNYQVVFWGNAEKIKIIPVEADIRSRKSVLGIEPNAWIFSGVRDSTIIQFNSPDTLYVSNICPYKKKSGDCYEVQTCPK